MASVIFNPVFQATDDNGNPLSGGKLYTYEPSTTTPKATYSDPSLTTENTNPIILDSRGEAKIYGSGQYKLVLYDSDDSLIWTIDEVSVAVELPYTRLSEHGSLANAVSSIGSTETTLLIDQPDQVGSDLSIPSNISLDWLQGNKITVGAGYMLTVYGHIDAGNYQIFDGSGIVVVDNGGEVRPEWWGKSVDKYSVTVSASSPSFEIPTRLTAVDAPGLINFKNKLINGNFDFWQRGTTLITTGTSYQYGPDRWFDIADGTGGSRRWSRQTFTLGQTDVPGEPKYFARLEVASAYSGSTYHYAGQAIENVRTLAGETVVVSGYIKSDASRSIPVKLIQHFGSGGSPSSDVETDLGTIDVTTSWQKFELSATLPSLAGKTLGDNGDDCLILRFEAPVNTTFQLDFARIQLEEGSVATDFEERPTALELMLCERYYEKSYDLEVSPGTANYSGSWIFNAFNGRYMRRTIPFNTPKRAFPTITLYNPYNGSTTDPMRNEDDLTDEPATADRNTTSSFRVTWNDNANDTGDIGSIHWTADAEIL